MEVKFSPDILVCLEALAKTGKFGKTSEEVVEFIIQHKVFLLDDVKKFTIAGLLLQGVEEGRIVRTVPGSNYSNSKALTNVKKDWNSYFKEEIPKQE